MQILVNNDDKRVSGIMCLAQGQKLIYSDYFGYGWLAEPIPRMISDTGNAKLIYM